MRPFVHRRLSTNGQWLAVNMAWISFRLTVLEALARVEVHAALGLQDTHVVIRVGLPANFVLWNVAEAAELAYWLGVRPMRASVRQGRIG